MNTMEDHEQPQIGGRYNISNSARAEIMVPCFPIFNRESLSETKSLATFTSYSYEMSYELTVLVNVRANSPSAPNMAREEP